MMVGEGLRVMVSVIVRGRAVLIRRPEVHPASVFAGTAAIGGHATGPAFASAGRAAVEVLQRLVFEFRIGVGRKGPDSGDLLVHVVVG